MFLIGLCLVVSATVFSQDIPSWKGSDLEAYLKNPPGEVAVINMWATFCKPCIEEIPGMIQIKEQYGNRVSLLLVSLDMKKMYPQKLKSFTEKNKYTVPVVWLNETNADYFCPILDPTWSGSIPATLIINTKSGYKKFFEEEMSQEEFEKEIKKALGF